MHTHPITQLEPAGPVPSVPAATRRAGRPGKHVQSPTPSRTLFRDGAPDRLLTLTEVLEVLGVARSTWDRWRRGGLTPALMVLPNGSVRVWESELIRWNRTLEVS